MCFYKVCNKNDKLHCVNILTMVLGKEKPYSSLSALALLSDLVRFRIKKFCYLK